MLLKEARAAGIDATLSDFDEVLGKLVPRVERLLTLNSGDPGKLRVMPGRLNPGNHDDSPPALAELRQCHGDLVAMKKKYLDQV
jgi:hypothetical protein